METNVPPTRTTVTDEPMPLRIFINYRRDDSSGYVGRLYDGLKDRSPDWQVFMDIDNIEPGADFEEVIERELDTCDVVIAVIGKQWLEAMDAKGRRRLDSPHDFVRLELAAALARNVRVIPTLVQQAEMPTSEELPESLMPLARRHAVELSNSRWGYDIERLVQQLQRIQDQQTQERTAAQREKERIERERLERDAAEREAAAREAATREQADVQARERAERDALQASDRERHKREAAAREAAEWERREQEQAVLAAAERERHERELARQETVERERVRREEAAREAAERAERKRAAREAKEAARRERQEHEATERRRAEEARLARDRSEKEERAQSHVVAVPAVAHDPVSAGRLRGGLAGRRAVVAGVSALVVVGGIAAAIVAVSSSGGSHKTAPPPAPSPALRIRIGNLHMIPSAPVAGERFDVQATALAASTGKAIPGAMISCRARVAAKGLTGTHFRQGGSSHCRWTIPRSAAGATLSGAVAISYKGTSASKTFQARVVRPPETLTILDQSTLSSTTPRAGDTLIATLRVGWVQKDGTRRALAPKSTSVMCSGTISGSPVGVTKTPVTPKGVSCSWLLPQNAGGKTLAISVNVRSEGRSARRRFTVNIAATPAPTRTPAPTPTPTPTPIPPPG